MFYSQCLLSKKGALGVIWVAAHCLKRLKKDEVSQTNISSCVDKILVDEVPVVTHRVLAFLLLGVVKIYSQKVDYLYDDCNRVVDKVNDFSGIKKKATIVVKGMRAPGLSITRPKRLDLEVFDLQILEGGNCDNNVRAAEDITLEDACTNEVARYHSSEKKPNEANIPSCSAEHTPAKDVLSPYTNEKNTGSSSINLMNSESSIENIRSINFSLDDRLEPMVLGEAEGEQELFGTLSAKSVMDGKQTNFSDKQNESSIENIRSNTFSLDDCLEPMVLGEAEGEQELFGTVPTKNETNGKQTYFSDMQGEPSVENLRENNISLDDRLDPMILGEAEGEQELFGTLSKKKETDENQTKFSDKQDEGYVEHINLSEAKLLESEKNKPNTEDRPVPMSVDVTFQSKGRLDQGIELIGVRTPVLRERGSSSRKRRCLFDEEVVLSNKVVKASLKDASSLVCKRRKAPHTALLAWKRHQISNLPRTFIEPLFPCSSVELRSLFSATKLKSTETVEEMENVDVPEEPNMTISPTRHKSPDEAFITPSTPVTQSAFIRSHDDVETTEFDRERPTKTFERIEEESSQSEEEDPERSLNNEMNNNKEMNSQGEIDKEGDGWSDTTRLIAKQLCRSILSQKKRGLDKGISLTQTLEKKIKSESARFFYETLVLKTRGYIDVEQREAYGDIIVLETPKLKQAYETGNF